MDSQAKWLDAAQQWQQTLMAQWGSLAKQAGLPSTGFAPLGGLPDSQAMTQLSTQMGDMTQVFAKAMTQIMAQGPDKLAAAPCRRCQRCRSLTWRR